MRSRAIGAVSAVVIGLGCVLLPTTARAEEGGPVAQSDSARRTATAEAERQANLVAGEDQRLMEALVAGLPTATRPKVRGAYRTSSSGLYTLVLTQRREPYTFDELRKLAAETLLSQDNGTFLLTENIVVGQGATLTISPSKPLKIRMASGPGGFVSLITQGGRLRLNGTEAAPITIESWDVSRGRTDTDVTDGRAYVRASGQLVIEHTSFSRLGFWSGRTGGVAVVGSGSALGQELDGRSAADDPEADDPVVENSSGGTQLLPTGKLPSAAADPDSSYGTRISNAKMTGNAFGLFVTGNTGATIENTVIRKSLVNGLVLHRDVESASVKNVRVEKSGSDGVVVSRKVEGTVLTRLVVRHNGRDGVVLAGRPLASGPSASGSSTRAFGNNVLTASESSNNARIGVHVIGGTSVRVQGNAVNGGRSGIVVSDGADDIDIDSNRVSGAAANGIQVRESRKVSVTANVVSGSQTGIHVRNSSGTFRQNSTSGVTLHGITFVGRAAGSQVGQNRFSGSGTSAIDVVRVTDQQVPELQENDLSGWSRTVTSDSLVSVLLHPLTVIWLLIALMLLVMSRPRRTGTGLPYRTDPLVIDETSFRGLPLPVELPRDPVELPRDPVELPRDREPVLPLLTLSERRAQSGRNAPVPGFGPAPGADPGPVPWTQIGPELEPESGLVPAWAASPAPVEPTAPVLLPAPPASARVGHPVIDLAIREARLNPAAPRRRRVNGR